MSIALRPSEARGHANHGWLDTFHTFSFAHYYDPAHMGFRALRVINDDVVRPGTGFATHGHRDMEIISYVVRGALAHEDTTGGKGVLNRGDVQYMSAGTGLRHSEFNASRQENVRFLQIWIVPPEEGLPPFYEQKTVSDADKTNTLAPIAAPAGHGAPLTLHQDVRVYASRLEEGHGLSHALAKGRGAWIQVVDGDLSVNGTAMRSGDGLAIEDMATLDVLARADTEFLLFDLA